MFRAQSDLSRLTTILLTIVAVSPTLWADTASLSTSTLKNLQLHRVLSEPLSISSICNREITVAFQPASHEPPLGQRVIDY